MTDEIKIDDVNSDELQELSQRFIKLWQEQLSLLADKDGAPVMPDDWATYWNGLMHGGMPVSPSNMGQSISQNMGYWEAIMPKAHVKRDLAESEEANSTDDNTGNKTTPDATDRPAPSSTTSVDTIDILRQLTSYIERIDQRLTKLEQQTVSSKAATKRPIAGKRSAKLSKAKPAKPKEK